MERITFSSDSETNQHFEEIAKKMGKTKSQLFRDFVKYFYKHKDNLSNGINIVISIPTPEINQNNTTEAIQE